MKWTETIRVKFVNIAKTPEQKREAQRKLDAAFDILFREVANKLSKKQ